MRKGCFALLMLALLFALSLWNIRTLDRLTSSMEEDIALSRGFCESENYSAAEATLRSALQTWKDAEGYTHVFIRHAEVDAASDAFFEALTALRTRNGEEALGAYDKLLYHLRSIDTMEHITLKAVF